jgi:hypothetical protein
LLEEITRQNDEDEDSQGYTIDKDFVLRAWKKFRPVSKEPTKQATGTSRK